MIENDEALELKKGYLAAWMKYLRKVRCANGITRFKVCKIAGYDEGLLQKYELGDVGDYNHFIVSTFHQALGIAIDRHVGSVFDHETFSRRIDEAVEKLGVNRKLFCERNGINVDTLRKHTNGTVSPMPKSILAYSKVLGCNQKELMKV